MGDAFLSLTSNWYLARGNEEAGHAALRQLAADVRAGEPDTLAYLVHECVDSAGPEITTLPPVSAGSIVFFEIYRSPQAFLNHLHGHVFKDFVAKHSSLFVNADGKPFTTVTFLHRIAGFIRSEAGSEAGSGPVATIPNRHPAVMFEVIGKDQANLKTFYSKVFGWNYEIGTGGFAYVHFPERAPALLGGIGQADSKIPGFEPGHSFYILVDDLEAAIVRAIAAGGSKHMDPASVDGYHFAMICDPEGNTLGLILPFDS